MRLVVGEAVVDREVRQVEEDVAHPRVLPVDDPDPAAVVDEVGGEQVVVAGPLRHRAARPLDERGRLARALERGRDGDAVRRGGGGVGLDDAERVEARRDRRARVDGPEGLRDAAERLRLPDRLRRDHRRPR